MGFFKNIFIESGFKRKKAEKILGELPRKILGRCRKCASIRITYSKLIGYGPKMGVVYHYKLKCGGCGTSYHVKRTKAVYEAVKNKSWVETKPYKKMMLQKV